MTPTIVGPALILSVVLLVLGMFAQGRIFWHEEAGTFCPRSSTEPAGIYSTASPCNRTGFSVQADHEFEVRFTVRLGDALWQDKGPVGEGKPATVAGVRSADQSWLMTAATPLKRVVRARYLQPIAVLRAKGGDRPNLVRLDPIALGKDTYVARFRAPVTGTVTLFANDAVPPWPLDIDLFYANNVGSADVELCEVGVTCTDIQADEAPARPKLGRPPGPAGPKQP